VCQTHGHASHVLVHDLNPAQRAAVEATTGPVCILAGAATGKTRVISRRVAYAIVTDAVHPRHVLVVTFTDKAAGATRAAGAARLPRRAGRIDFEDMFARYLPMRRSP
jgi:DNA helicase II / ATP-dependent DNA helicase PcrA